MGVKVKKDKQAAANKPAEQPKRTAEKPATGGQLYKVELEGVKQGAVLEATSTAEAKQAFLDLFGITGTERKIVVSLVDRRHGLAVRKFGLGRETAPRFKGIGVIDYFHRETTAASDEATDDDDSAE